MYDYVLVFLSTMFATALVTRWLYQEEKALEALQALKAKKESKESKESKEESKEEESKESKEESKAQSKEESKESKAMHAPQTPINIPTLSREKHDERTRLIEEWTIKYMQLVKQAEAQEKAEKAQVKQPLAQAKQEPLAQVKSTPESNAEHDAAIKAKKFPDREYIYSDSILPHERTPTHLTRSMQEWWEFERQHSAAPIGSWIHYENPKVHGETTIRVTYAILRIDAPERWEERVYFYHVGETCSA